MRQLRIGISGWTYPPWRGVFFPAGWPQKRELEFASRQVNSIEINGSFYSLQRPSSYRAWYAATPPDFVFAVKGSRFITHMKRLRDIEVPLANFFASGLFCLREKLGPILWQFPPMFSFDPNRLAAFFELLPRDTGAASKLARRHDARVKGRAEMKTDRVRPVRHAIEVRHPSFESAEFVKLLRAHDIGLVVADTAGKWPLLEDVTSNFVYVRLHGDKEIYVSGYTNAALEEWARKIKVWARGGTPARTRRLASPTPRVAGGRDIFVYFDNDVKVRAPFDAMTLAHRLGLRRDPGAPPIVPWNGIPVGEAARNRWPGFSRRQPPNLTSTGLRRPNPPPRWP
jgi:uncharacterized protein YecE (DUF72 family)